MGGWSGEDSGKSASEQRAEVCSGCSERRIGGGGIPGSRKSIAEAPRQGRTEGMGEGVRESPGSGRSQDFGFYSNSPGSGAGARQHHKRSLSGRRSLWSAGLVQVPAHRQHVPRPDVGTAKPPLKGRVRPTNHFGASGGQRPRMDWGGRGQLKTVDWRKLRDSPSILQRMKQTQREEVTCPGSHDVLVPFLYPSV